MNEASIIIPTYNEIENIKKLIPSLENVISSNRIKAEIIVIDDNSPDGTGRLVQSLMKKYKNIRLISRKGKKGVGSARRLGFSSAKKQIIISMEGDNTHNPKYLPFFIKEINKGADLVIGSRYLPSSKIINWPLKRKIVSRTANFIARVLGGAKLTDVTNGYRAFTKSMYNKLTIESISYPYNMEFACEAYSRGFKIKEIPIIFIDRVKGKSKMSVTKEFLSFIYTAFKFTYTYRPLLVFGLVGGLIFLIGFLIALYLTFLKFTLGVIGNRLLLIILALVLIISGIQIFSFGLISSVLSKLRKEMIKVD